VADNASFAEKFRYPFPLLCDEQRSIGLAYGACDSPAAATARRISYVIDGDGRIARAYPKVSPKAHPQEVLDFLAANASP
jgi:peroxiredoxin Q/BCP